MAVRVMTLEEFRKAEVMAAGIIDALTPPTRHIHGEYWCDCYHCGQEIESGKYIEYMAPGFDGSRTVKVVEHVCNSCYLTLIKEGYIDALPVPIIKNFEE